MKPRHVRGAGGASEHSSPSAFETWNAQQCADYLQISVRHLRDLPVPRRYVGRIPRYDPETVRRWVAEGSTGPRRRVG